MKLSNRSSRTLITTLVSLSTCVTRALAIPVAQTFSTDIRTSHSLPQNKATSRSPSDPDRNVHSLTARQISPSTPEVFVYYGQVLPSPGADLTDICADPNIDKIALAFVTSFADSAGYPILSIGKNCPTTNDAQTAAGASGLHDCVTSGLAKQVEACQDAGKPVLLSLGGGAATEMVIPSQDAAMRYAQSIWDLFLGNVGNTDLRPFGSTILDGIDIDIEHGSGAYLIDFVVALRKLMDASTASTGKRYYLTAAPQCSDLITPTSSVQATTIPWMTLAPYLDSMLVQFYNNPTCDLSTTSLFMSSLAAWSDALANITPVVTGMPTGEPYSDISTAPKPNYRVVTVDGLSRRSDSQTVQPSSKGFASKRDAATFGPKLLIGVSATSEVGSGYLPISDLAEVFQQVSVKALPNVAGVMFWDGVWCMTASASITGGQTFQQVAKSVIGKSA